MFSYFAYGLAIKSEIELLEFIPAQLPGDITIRWNRNATIPDEVKGNHTCFIKVTLEEAILFDKKAALFIIRNGCEIIVTPLNDDERLISLYIVGTIMSILLYQRGLFVLHGSAVEFDGSAIAFVGKSGWGKSTIAAALHTKGHRIITDDVVAISTETDTITVFPGYPQFKLFPEVAEILGHDQSELLLLHSQLKKGGFRVAKNFSQTALPLKRIYMLSKDSTVGIKQLRSPESLTELMRNSLPTRWYQVHNTAQFLQCTKIAKNIPSYRLIRSSDLRSLPTLAEMVEAHLIGNLQSSIA
ncbi:MULTISPECIES: hypothetical protein [unclassified Anabaena]|uniref:hypothetical protein n=1 Tax=unclassified Anabaena TaxID=2619674 RepID=UPI0039C71520